MTRKDIEVEIANEQAEKLYNDLLEKSSEFAGRWFDGCLMDEFAVVMIDNRDWQIRMQFGRPILSRKYVYAREQYVNCWASKLILTLTDNKKEFLAFVKSRFEKDENLDMLDFEDFCYENGLND